MSNDQRGSKVGEFNVHQRGGRNINGSGMKPFEKRFAGETTRKLERACWEYVSPAMPHLKNNFTWKSSAKRRRHLPETRTLMSILPTESERNFQHRSVNCWNSQGYICNQFATTSRIGKTLNKTSKIKLFVIYSSKPLFLLLLLVRWINIWIN